jgi:hypothetical protein
VSRKNTAQLTKDYINNCTPGVDLAPGVSVFGKTIFCPMEFRAFSVEFCEKTKCRYITECAGVCLVNPTGYVKE